MRGDFSAWNKDRAHNFRGTLHQQGRVLLDRDWNAQTEIMGEWQEIAARDAFGAGVAAVPAEQPLSFKVTQASITGGEVKVYLKEGRVWADGLLVELDADPAPFPPAGFPALPAAGAEAIRTATYLGPPIQPAPLPGAPPANNLPVRDAVILETWLEELSPFQNPNLLIEPALGGVDTTERVQTAYRFRLFRMAPEDTCDTIIPKLKDEFDSKGKLTVELKSTTESGGDCPVVMEGGFTGFEHRLYRIEIADTDKAGSYFKWSHFNGGLVGTGDFDNSAPASPKVVIHGNKNAILYSGSNDFYVEALDFDKALGHWKVIYGAKATLANDGTLSLPMPTDSADIYKGSMPPAPASGKRFFRLWNGIERVNLFSTAKKELPDNIGIVVRFEAEAAGKYTPSDFWTFEVRAGDIGNPLVLVGIPPATEGGVITPVSPQGISYHRVPLAELKWGVNRTISFENEEIEDCRRIFRPLTNQKICCSYTVGDGKSSHGDFDAIEEAVRHLPDSGGEICLLPGLHEANVEITGKQNIKISGCDKNTRVIPRQTARQAPIFKIVDSQCITLENMDLATLEGTAVVLEGSEPDQLREIDIHNNRILAAKQAIRVKQGTDINIHHNKIRLLDREDGGVAIYMLADRGTIERNDIAVIPAGTLPPSEDIPDDGETLDPADPCVNPELIYNQPLYFIALVSYFWAEILPFIGFEANPFKALGGIQIAAGSENLSILRNQINGGAGNGITLGSGLDDLKDSPEDSPPDEKIFEIENEHEGIWGRLLSGGNHLRKAGVPIRLKEKDALEDHAPLSTTTGRNGRFQVQVDQYQGEVVYEVFVTGYKIEEIEKYDQVEFRVEYRIHVVEAEDKVDLSELFPPISDVAIDRNEITNVGGSGIGLPSVSDETLVKLKESGAADILNQIRLLGFFSSYAVNLSIHRNHIFNCVQNAFKSKPLRSMDRLGAGGVSLGFCTNLLIDQNRIEDNGQNHPKPVCGIFVFYADGINLSHNRLINNGLSTTDNFPQGTRGGVVLELATSLNSKYAIRIHDNVVEQPLGRALTIKALGPVSVVNNQLNSDVAEPKPNPTSNLPKQLLTYLFTNAGAVLIQNFGTTILQNGNTLFNSNQIRLGTAGPNRASVVIFSPDDIGFEGNQSDVLKNQPSDSGTSVQSVNTLLFAQTLRAGDSRFKEPTGGHWLSLLTLSRFMNTTTNNQGNNCIIAICSDSSREIDRDNLDFIPINDICSGTKRQLRAFFQPLWRSVTPHLGIRPFNPFGGDPLNSLGRLKDIQVINHSLFQYEARRLSVKFGQNDPRVQQIRERLSKNQNLIKDLEIQIEVAKIRVPEVSEDDALIHGRIVDENQRGLAGLTVFVEDKEQKIIGSFGASETNSSGYYAFSVNEDELKNVSERIEGGAFITISSPSRRIIYRHAKPLQLVKSARIEVGAALDRTTLKPIGGGGKPIVPDDSKVEDKENGKISSIALDKIGGIGPANANKLRAAKIADVKAFSEAKEEELKEILKTIYIDKIREMKKQAKTLLEEANKNKND